MAGGGGARGGGEHCCERRRHHRLEQGLAAFQVRPRQRHAAEAGALHQRRHVQNPVGRAVDHWQAGLDRRPRIDLCRGNIRGVGLESGEKCRHGGMHRPERTPRFGGKRQQHDAPRTAAPGEEFAIELLHGGGLGRLVFLRPRSQYRQGAHIRGIVQPGAGGDAREKIGHGGEIGRVQHPGRARRRQRIGFDQIDSAKFQRRERGQRHALHHAPGLPSGIGQPAKLGIRSDRRAAVTTSELDSGKQGGGHCSHPHCEQTQFVGTRHFAHVARVCASPISAFQDMYCATF